MTDTYDLFHADLASADEMPEASPSEAAGPPARLGPVLGEPDRFRFRDRPSGEVIEVELYFYRGQSPLTRGIYLAVRPLTIRGDLVTCVLLQGRSTRVRPLARRAPAVLGALASAAAPGVPGLAAAFRRNREAGEAALEQLAASLREG